MFKLTHCLVARRQRAMLAIAGLLLAAAATAADPFPVKPVNIMVPYPAGGLSDVIARVVNTPLATRLGKPVVVENLGGASGAIGAQKVLGAPADGYYLFQGSPNELILSPLANAAVKFRSEDFRLIQMIGVANVVLLARKELSANNIDELIALAQKNRNLTYGSVGVGSFYHLLGEDFSMKIDAPMVHVPYKGAAPVIQDLIGGQIDLFFAPFGKSHDELAAQGRIKVIGTLSKGRPEALKHLPSINEGKTLKDFTFTIWTGYFVRKETPEAVVVKLHKALTDTLNDPAVRKGLEANSLEVAQPLSLAEAESVYRDGAAQFRAIAKSVNLTPQ
nr:tripartite tricarboxylate transporter substrate binding protein [uncultured Noviherbaspirillum sp.]